MKLQWSLLLLGLSFKLSAQFHFSGTVNQDYTNATAYLSLVEDCNKKSLFFAESIIQESEINDGQFSFEGDFLDTKNRIYKIHIDNCNDDISNYKHLLNHCQNSKEIIFIANNSDRIDFPLNDLSQVFCDIIPSKSSNNAIHNMEELQENILSHLQNLKSDRQRQRIYERYFKELQNFSKSFHEPLVELYAYHLYANEQFLSRAYYLDDLKKSHYYNDLLQRLESSYPNTSYVKLYKNALLKDQYPLLESKNNTYKILVVFLTLLLVIALGIILYLIKKSHSTITEKVDYKTVLTAQEQNVFELMLDHSNKQIADILFVSLSTVKTHINTIYSKLAISSRKDITHFFE